ncbi:MAG: TspO/MBR family protein [Thermaurantiacus tibetensis]|uniref:TspO/MBR family protein n=1 Tax=Thermaurantiacus tibetensis TaxID=2759035 RepID=UPI00188F6DC8|nr:TspO/MBR family protein [Thermaurantiacus tibetensis]
MFDGASLAALAISLGAVLVAASTGAIFRPGAWYAGLEKPLLTPPNWAFPAVWGLLYVLMAVAAWRVWEAGGTAARGALLLYAVHLVLNAAWSWLFFGRKRIDLAMAEVVVFWLSILAVTIAFARFDQIAAWLMVPYHAWVTLAAILNWRFLALNGPRGEGRAERAADDLRSAWSRASPPAR